MRNSLKFLANPLVCLGLVLFSFLLFSQLTSEVSSEDLVLASVADWTPKESQNKVFLSQKDQVEEGFELLAVGGTCLKATGPVTVAHTQTLGGTAQSGDQNAVPGGKEVLEYQVQPGDTLSSIAESFGVSLSTVLWANDLSRTSSISVGQKLTILPVSGVMHLVNKGETVSHLAQAYQAEISEIREFNELPEDDKIVVGDLVIVPGGEPPARPTASASRAPSGTPSGASSRPSAPTTPNYFICPVPAPCNITQGLHWYNAIDFSNGACGQPVFASAGGTVQKTGYDRYAGNYVRILHPNGVVTFYGHFSRYVVSPGQRVYQGQIIGYIGNTGYTIGPSGCHVHFEVRGARNPFAY